MFDGPEYASYIVLCRKLRIHRAYRTGDYVFYERPGRIALLGEGQDADAANLGVEPKLWLPRLDQWLAMLEEADYSDGFCVHTNYGPVFTASAHNRVRKPEGYSAQGPTREEAAARLWMAVTKTVAVPTE